MKNVAICLSGHPRAFMKHVESWSQYFRMIRNEYNLRIFFHCWADQGLVHLHDNVYIEGKLVCGYFREFNELIEVLDPNAFAIESISADLAAECKNFPHVYLSNWQAGRNKILSQLYSINRSDLLRREFESASGVYSDVVIRMRFDAIPHNLTLNEIRYVETHPDAKVLFAPSPVWHVHPGGGGGCRECHAFFDANWLDADFDDRAREFLAQHSVHSNDICDIFAVSSPSVMEKYTSVYSDAKSLNSLMISQMARDRMEDYTCISDSEHPLDQRIIATKNIAWDIENSPVFTPEKLIRHQMSGIIVVHGETVVVINRR